MNMKNELIAFCICVNQSKDDPKFDLESYADEYIERNPNLKDENMKLWKVKFKKWIPRESEKTDSGFFVTKKGTGCFEDDFKNEGIFHQWGIAYEEFENGPGNYSIALVELPDGTIEEVLPLNIKFIDKE